VSQILITPSKLGMPVASYNGQKPRADLALRYSYDGNADLCASLSTGRQFCNGVNACPKNGMPAFLVKLKL
jgi:hypothetical protein